MEWFGDLFKSLFSAIGIIPAIFVVLFFFMLRTFDKILTGKDELIKTLMANIDAVAKRDAEDAKMTGAITNLLESDRRSSIEMNRMNANIESTLSLLERMAPELMGKRGGTDVDGRGA